MASLEQMERALRAAGQQHVLRFWPELSQPQRDAFLQDLAQLDLEGLRKHCDGAVRAAATPACSLDPDQDLEQNLEPVSLQSLGSVRRSSRESLTAWEREGLLQISEGRVGVVLLAGGQGTRLGVHYPKGMYDVGLPSGKTLYQIQAERLRKVQELAGRQQASACSIPWYIMTSEFTLAATEKFFQENDYFGLEPANIIMFEQRTVPAVGLDGKLILQDKGKLAMAPDGNGGLFRALADNKVLDHMRRRGVQYLHVYCVDNILIKMADPVFIGFCVSRGADCGAKVVAKACPTEPVGVVCRVGGMSQVVEYSEIRPEVAALRGPGGELVYGAGNICNHFFTRSFLQDAAENLSNRLKQHAAIKKVPFVDPCGNHVRPTKPNAIKMEKFVFDVFPFSRNFVVFEVLREDEFSPLKNAAGAATDSATTARAALLAQHCRWAVRAGAALLDEDGSVLPPADSAAAAAQLEVSPLVSYCGEGLEPLLKGRMLKVPFLLDVQRAEELQAGGRCSAE